MSSMINVYSVFEFLDAILKSHLFTVRTLKNQQK